MRSSWKALSRCRPRVLTLVVLIVVGAVLVLANLSDEVGMRFGSRPPMHPARGNAADLSFDVREPLAEDRSHFAGWNVSYGWPLLWRQYVFIGGYAAVVQGECRSTNRFAANLAMWLIMLAAPAAICEWLMRRYRPRLRWSLRTMLIAIGLAAACCGSFVTARDRAAIEDPLIADGRVWVESWGPHWLELLGADRLCRSVVGAELVQAHVGDERVEDLLKRLAPLRDVQYVFVTVRRLTPGMVGAVRDMRRLRALDIDIYLGMFGLDDADPVPGMADALGAALADKRQLRALSINLDGLLTGREAEAPPNGLQTAIGTLAQLEALSVTHSAVDRLDYLAGLTRLKSLTLDMDCSGGDGPASGPPLLSRLPTLPLLETIDLRHSDVNDGDLRYLDRFPRLRSLNLTGLALSGAGLADLASLKSLEELAINSDALSTAGVESLLALKRIRTLHVRGVDYQRRAVEALRRSKPELSIDGDTDAVSPPVRAMVRSHYEPSVAIPTRHVREMLRQWQIKQAGRGKNNLL